MLSCLKGKYDRAIEDLNKAKSLGGLPLCGWDDSDFYQNRALFYLDKGDFRQAVADASEAIRLNPKNGAAYCVRADARARLGQIEEAQRDLDRAEKVDRDDPYDMYTVAWTLVTCPDPRLRDADRAVEIAAQLVEASPKDGSNWGTLGAGRHRAGDWKGAVAALTKANEFRIADDAGDSFFLAMAHWQLGNKAEARQWYDKGAKWMDKNAPGNNELRRFRTEAAELLGITYTPPEEKEQADKEASEVSGAAEPGEAKPSPADSQDSDP
jgi:tetratricopeptide (TPR) repeat protein